MTSLSVRNVVVVGGGVAGYLAALFIRTFIGETVNVTVIAAPDVAPMTVGESTNGPFTGLLNSLGIDRDTLIRECDATIKIASEFADWTPRGEGHRWVHEFQPTVTHLGIPLYHYWLQRSRSEAVPRYQDACFVNSALIEECRVPFQNEADLTDVSFGYHLDGHKLGAVLRDRAAQRGAHLISAKVVSAKKNGADRIESVLLDNGEEVHGDFFIDATGFSRRLANLAYPDHPDFRFEPYSDYHFCDRAVYVTLPSDSPDIRPSTLSTALSSGWVWDIPLNDRVSYGYVYSSRHLERAEAEREFRRFLSLPEETGVRFLEWMPGRINKAWLQNCLCIGVSNAFIEPIESLTSATLCFELHSLLRHFPAKDFNPSNIDSYCHLIADKSLDNRDFISLHYQTSRRTDTGFWRDIRYRAKVAPRISDLINNFATNAPLVVDGIYESKAIFGMFAARSYTPTYDLPILAHLDASGVKNIMDVVQVERATSRNLYLKHSELIRRVCVQR